MLAARPAHASLIYLITLMIFCEDFKLRPVITQFSPASYYFLLFRSKYSQQFALRYPQSDGRSLALIQKILNIILLRRFSTSVG
jgi:hypothetical protein